jgi:hypothetical protein
VTQIHPEHSADESIHAGESSVVNKTTVKGNDRTISVVAIALAVAALVSSLWSSHESSISEREARMLQYYVLEMDAKLIKAGVKKPEDSIAEKLSKEK